MESLSISTGLCIALPDIGRLRASNKNKSQAQKTLSITQINNIHSKKTRQGLN